MKPQRFWAVLDRGEVVADQVWDTKKDAVGYAQSRKCLGYGYGETLVREVRIIVLKPKPKKRKARKGAK